MKWGIIDGAWQKIGKNADVGDTENIMFRMSIRDAMNYKDSIWEAWYINKERFTIGKLTELMRKKSDIGLVFAHTAITYKIKNGVYPTTMFLPEEN